MNDAGSTCVNLVVKLEQHADMLDDVRSALLDLVSKIGDAASLVGDLLSLVIGGHSEVVNDIETVIGNFNNEAGELAQHPTPYAELAEQISKTMLRYAGMTLHNVAADLINVAASCGNAIAHDPLHMGADIGLTTAGVGLMVLGAGGEVLGATLDVTRIGAAVSIAGSILLLDLHARGGFWLFRCCHPCRRNATVMAGRNWGRCCAWQWVAGRADASAAGWVDHDDRVARVDYFDDPSAPVATGRVPGVVAAVRDEAGRLLLIRRMDLSLWALPGGRIELGETVAQAVVREVREETGVEIEVTGFGGIYTDPRPRVRAGS